MLLCCYAALGSPSPPLAVAAAREDAGSSSYFSRDPGIVIFYDVFILNTPSMGFPLTFSLALLCVGVGSRVLFSSHFALLKMFCVCTCSQIQPRQLVQLLEAMVANLPDKSENINNKKQFFV